jgi:hypothetical protein
MLILGVALVWVTSRVMSDQARSDGIGLAQSIEAYATAPVPEEAYTIGVLDPATVQAVAMQVSGFTDLQRLRLWTVDGTLLFDSRSDATGFADGDRLDAAVRQQEPDAEVVTEVRGDEFGGTESTLLDVYVPIDHEGTVVGAAEVMLDYSGTTAAVASAVRTVSLVVAGGLVILWLLLFRTVWNASRRLQSSAPSPSTPRPGPPSAWHCWTSTGSRTSTTPSATTAATSCWSRWPPGCAARCARTTWWPGSAATSSRSCCRTCARWPTPTPRPAGCASCSCRRSCSATSPCTWTPRSASPACRTTPTTRPR